MGGYVLADLENGIVSLVKTSSLGLRLRQVDTLPDLEGDNLVNRFLTDAPAVYVAMGSFPVRARYAKPKFGIACVARNSRSHQAARHGDGVVIGLYEMLEAVMSLVDGNSVVYGQGDHAGAVSLEVLSCDLMNSEVLYKAGVYVGIVQIQTSGEVTLPGALDADALADFQTFHADFDIAPHQSRAEHDKWLQEPPNLTSSSPELSDHLSLNQE